MSSGLFDEDVSTAKHASMAARFAGSARLSGNEAVQFLFLVLIIAGVGMAVVLVMGLTMMLTTGNI